MVAIAQPTCPIHLILELTRKRFVSQRVCQTAILESGVEVDKGLWKTLADPRLPSEPPSSGGGLERAQGPGSFWNAVNIINDFGHCRFRHHHHHIQSLLSSSPSSSSSSLSSLMFLFSLFNYHLSPTSSSSSSSSSSPPSSSSFLLRYCHCCAMIIVLDSASDSIKKHHWRRLCRATLTSNQPPNDSPTLARTGFGPDLLPTWTRNGPQIRFQYGFFKLICSSHPEQTPEEKVWHFWSWGGLVQVQGAHEFLEYLPTLWEDGSREAYEAT